MKKIALSILIAFCAILMCVGVVACKDSKSSAAGRYETVSVTVDGTSYDVGEKIPAGIIGKGEYTVRKDDMIVVISKASRSDGSNKWGSFTYQRSFGGGLDSAGGSWSEEDGNIKFSVNGSNLNKMVLTLSDDGKLSVKQEYGYGAHQIEFTMEKVK